MGENEDDIVFLKCELMKSVTIQFEKGGKHNYILHSESCEKSGHNQLGDFSQQL